ncbi:hypothetical protein [Shewanella sp. SM23]|uniref:hypothetical protein n=1 Tax=Shewanella sp. SM23 TaxID=2912794 RepID=UPI0021DB3D3B|nr:hypothetical protein [Shewanella sp. SM23]MCU8083706.1 hypothetical protein [Shewanella sp. SM23]
MSVLTWIKQRLARNSDSLKQSRPQTELRTVFHQTQMPNISLPIIQTYPLVVPMDRADIFAYQLHCLLTYQGKEALNTLLSQAGFNTLPEQTVNFNGFIEHPTQATCVLLNQYDDFAGVCITLVTNDKPLLEALIRFKSAPPNPWESFPNIDPDTLGSLQGNIDFWCSYFWRPYWLSLSETERLQYPESWREFSEFH